MTRNGQTRMTDSRGWSYQIAPQRAEEICIQFAEMEPLLGSAYIAWAG